MLVVERVRQHRDVAVAELEAELGTHLEVAGQHACAFRHLLQFVAYGGRQRFPAGEVARVVLVTGQLFAQRRRGRHQVIAEGQCHADAGQPPAGAAQPARPAVKYHRHRHQQRQVARQRPMEADALDIGEEAQQENAQR